MRNYWITLVLLFSLIHTQVVFASRDLLVIRPIKDVIGSYNEIRENPGLLAQAFNHSDRKIYEEMLLKNSISSLPLVALRENGSYQIISGTNIVILDEKNWNSKKLIVNNFVIDFKKVTSLSQLANLLSKVMTPKKTSVSLFKMIKNLFLKEAHAFEFGMNKETGLIAAAVLAVVGIGYLIYKNNKGNKKKDTKEKTPNAPIPISGSDPSVVGEVDKTQFKYHGLVASGEQFDVVVKDQVIHLVSDKYYQLDINGKVILSENNGDGQQCGMCFPPALAVDSSGAVHTMTRHDGGWNEGHDIKYRRRNASGQWQYDYMVGTRKKRNYVVSIASPSESEVYMSSTSAGEDVGGNIVFWKEVSGKASLIGELSGIWRSDAGTKMRGLNGKIFLVSGDPGPMGTAYYSYAKSGDGFLDELKNNLKAHRGGEGRRGVPDLYMDKLGDVHLSYGASQTVFYNRYKLGETKVLESDLQLFENLGDAHLNGIGVSALAASDDGNTIMVVAVHNQTGDLLIRISGDQGKSFSEAKKLGVQSKVDESRLRPVVVAVGSKFFIFYWDKALNGIGLITKESMDLYR